MLRNIVVTSLRNFLRNKSFSLINLIGLSVSMSLAMLIIMIIREQYTFDNFHKDADRIYRVQTQLVHPEWGNIDFASTPLSVGQVLKDDYPFAEDVVRISRQLYGDVTYQNVNVPLQGLIVDPTFLTVFNFPLEKGNPSTALTAPNSLVITSETAQKIFGNIEPLGQSITLKGYGEFTITGVLQKLENKTHFEFEALCSMSTLAGLEKNKVVTPSLENWSAYSNNYVYFKLKEGHTPEEATLALAGINEKYGQGLKEEGRDISYSFSVQPLNKISPGPELAGQMGKAMPAFVLVFLGVLGAVVLLMSVFNFTNLTIAKSLSRAREIGVRKVVGAKRHQVFVQFIGEAVIFSLIALAFSYLLLQFLKTGYLQLSLNEDFVMTFDEDIFLYFLFVAFAVAVGILAGVLPATYLSAFKPAHVFKDAQNLKVYSRLTFRKVLMVAQFTLSVIFVIVVLVIYRQVDFMLTADYGIDQKNNMNLSLDGVPFQKIADEARSLPGVVSVGGVSNRLGTFDGGTSNYKRSTNEDAISMYDFSVDDNYLENLGVKFLAGRNFKPDEQSGRERHVVLNQTAVADLGFEFPVDAIGKTIYADDSLTLQIIGVVKDFNFRPLNNKIGALALRYNLQNLAYMSIRIAPSHRESVTAAITEIWKKHDGVHAPELVMMEQEIDEAYRESGMQDMVVMIGYTAFLVISLACLGMLGMAMYASQVRAKEVGLRKVMGASVVDVILLLSKSFLMLIAIAVIIGVPVSFMLGQVFLEGFAYRIEITPLLIISSIGLIIALGLLTIWSQTISVATSNPVKWLRHD